MDNTGWVKLHRQMLDWEWFTDIPTCHFFIYCLLKANHEPRKWRGEAINEGQFVFGLKKASLEAKISVQQIRTALNKLKSTNELTIKSTNKFSLIAIVNWQKFQTTNKQINTQPNKQITNNQQTNNNKQEGKNEKNEKKDARELPEIVWQSFTKKKNRGDAEKAWKQMNPPLDLVLSSLKKLGASEAWLKENGKYVPYPATWLRAKGWLDEVSDAPLSRDFLIKEAKSMRGTVFEKKYGLKLFGEYMDYFY